MTDDPAAHGLTLVAEVDAYAATWDGTPAPATVVVSALPRGVQVGVVGVALLPLTADEALELADALAEAAAVAGDLAEEQAPSVLAMAAHAKAVVESTLGIRWPG